MTKQSTDINHMRAALALARRGLGNVWPNPAVGCVLVRQDMPAIAADVIVGRGWTQPSGRPHAESEALGRAGKMAAGATAYITLEPCNHHGQTPPCSAALIAAGIRHAVIAMRDPDPRVSGKGVARLQNAGIKVSEGVLADEAYQLNMGFFLKIKQRRPLFTLKLATDRNGKIPPVNADEKWITAALARQYGHLLRANHDAVLFGIGTVLDDNPQYTCRLSGMAKSSPVRIVMDSRLRLPDNCQLLQTLKQSPLLIITGKNAENKKYNNIKNLEIITAEEVDENNRPTPQWLALELARRGLTRVLVEAGPEVSNSFLFNGLIDHIYWFQAKKGLGNDAVTAVAGIDEQNFIQTNEFCLGDDTLATYSRRI